MFPDAIIHCFEPDPRAIAAFRILHAESTQVYLHQVAIGQSDGIVDFYVSDGIHSDEVTRRLRPNGWDLSGSIKKPKNTLAVNPWCTFEEVIRIKCMTLDTWARHHLPGTAIDLIWMDVQGAEGDVLKNSQLAQKHTRYIFTEYSDDELYEGQPTLRELMSILQSFSVLKLYDNDVLMKNCSFVSPSHCKPLIL